MHISSLLSFALLVSPPNAFGGALPPWLIERAAALSAWYSKARDARSVEVHYCKTSQVSKPRGAPAGLVELASYEKLRVKPASFDKE
jgi:predicted ribosome quality control (RQC) complex YloA/Tae2 family protein